ncbi:MAG: tandem-95 repeat protein, partial [Deltaproteobacteria bacterium]|nr:tandem-95 repeat protein [Deltaproteobacteria bacterium]
MSRFHTSSIVFGISLLAALSTEARAIDIERVSSPIFYIDDAHGDAYRGMYAGYRITNDEPVAYPNLWVKLGGFVPGANVGLAAYEDGVTTTGPLAIGESRVVFFYLAALQQKLAPESHTVSVYASLPLVTPVASASFALTTESTITASSNKVLTVSYAPMAPVLGGELHMTITGETGTIGGARHFAFTPASRLDWPSNSYELVGTTLLLGANPARFDSLFVTAASSANQAYTITYTFRVVCAAEGTQISMLNHIDSGNNNKHNDPTLLPVAPVPPPTESPLILTRSPTSPMIDGGTTLTHTFTVLNTGYQPVTFDDLFDVLLPGPLDPGTGQPARGAYVMGSTTLDGAPFADPIMESGTALHWSSSFPLGAGESMTLAFQVSYPPIDGTYTQEAHGEVSSSALGLTCGDGTPTQIDTTPSLGDDAPATVQVGVGTLDVHDDLVAAAEGAPLQILVGALTANDGTHAIATFQLLSTTTDRGGSVTYNPITGVVTYVAPAGVTDDAFHYRVCSVISPAICQTGDVLVAVNRRPTQANTAVYDVIGAPYSALVVADAFADPDGDALGAVTVTASPGGTTTLVGGELRFAPLVPGAAGQWIVSYQVCDDGAPAACTSATLVVVHNDPPVLDALVLADGSGLMLAYGDITTVPFSRLFVSHGVVAADDPGDGDSDGIGGVRVSATLDGPWGESAALPSGASCAAEPDLDVRVTAATTAGDTTCFVRVCEELPADAPGVCTTTRVEARVVECLTTEDCEVGQVCDPDTHACVPCRDSAEYPFVDEGCFPQKPICDEEPAVSVCVECQDSAPGNALDVGCTAAQPVCDEAAAGGPDCVECLTSEDCELGEVCDPATHTCIGCLDTEPPGQIDPGCEPILNACEGLGEAASCVDCQHDLDCARGDVCDYPRRTCVDCLPTADPDDVDPGCDPETPECIVGDDGDNVCVECVDDSDCEEDEICELSTNTCILRDVVDARDDLYVTPVATPLEVPAPALGVLGNDRMPPGAIPTATVVDGTAPDPATEGTLVFLPDGTFTFVPFATFVGTVTFEYDLETVAGGLDRATARIVVNAPPVAADDLATTPEDVEVIVDVLDNDADPNTDPAQALVVARVVDEPAHGEATVVSPRWIRYAPAPDWHGQDDLSYEVCDPHGACDSARVTVTVTPVNDPPVGRDDHATTPEDTAVLLDVLYNDTDIEGDALYVTRVVTPPRFGAASVLADGTLLYLPEADRHGVDALGYELCDANDACVVVDAIIDVIPQGDAPRASDDAVTTPAAIAVEVDVLANDVDPDGDPLRLARVVIAPTSGTATIMLGGELWYVPSPGFVGEDRLVYEACDPSGACDEAVLTVFVGGADLAPLAMDDLASTPEGVAVAIDVLANDVDPDDDPLAVVDVTPPAHGSIDVDLDGVVTYTPDGDFAGLETFAYTVCDPLGACDVALVRVTVEAGPNQPPIALDDLVTTARDVPVAIRPTANDHDPDGDFPVLVQVGAPAHGLVTTLGEVITYTPNPGFVGRDELLVRIADGRGGTATSRVVILVTPLPNVAPLALDDTYDVVAETGYDLDVLANDDDLDGDALTLIAVVQPTTAVATLDDGAVHLETGPAAQGLDTFTYVVTDGRGGFAEATVTLVWPAPPVLPIAADDWTTTREDVAVLVVVTANDHDPDGRALDVTRVVTGPRHGAVTLFADDTALYTPDEDFVGADGFTYEICAGAGPAAACATARVTVLVAPENEAPITLDDSATTGLNQAVTIAVLINDHDPDGDPLTVARISTPPAYGEALLLTGHIRYTPAYGFVGSDALRYEACDPAGLCGEALLTIHVGLGNAAPLAMADNAATLEGEPVVVDVLDNDADPDGDPLALVAVTDPVHGTTTFVGMAVRYTPDPDYVGIDTFAYLVCDDATPAGCSSGLVVVWIEPGANQPPIATDDLATTVTGVPVALPVLLNDADPDGDPLRVWSLGEPAHGMVSAARDGVVTYVSDPGFVGEDHFLVTISDAHDGLASAWATVRVTAAPNQPPDAADDVAGATPGVPLALDVLANDDDPDGDGLAIVFVFQPAQGVVTFDAGGGLVYAPRATADGADAFRYTVSDGRGGLDTATVTVTFPVVNRAPVAIDDFGMVREGERVLVVVLGNDYDPEGRPLDVTFVSQPLYGSVTVLPDDSVVYLAAGDYDGPDAFGYRVCDPQGACGEAHVMVTVLGANDPPTAMDDAVATAR